MKPLILLLAVLTALSGAEAGPVRERRLMDADWKFFLGDPSNAQQPQFDDTDWRTLDLPHDWSIEGKTNPKNPMGGAGGFFPAGVGWYRHSFQAPTSWKGKRVSVEFEGVYMNAEVWLNGESLGRHPYGYTSFILDLTPRLKIGEKNFLAVRVDNAQQKNSRWYSGSGIYRHVWLGVTDPVHVAPWGVFVSTPKASEAGASVLVQSTLANDSQSPRAVVLQTELIGPDGKIAAQAKASLELAGSACKECKQEIPLKQPTLWSPDSPRMYRAITRVTVSGKVVDEVETPFGVRSLEWSAQKGLELNGHSIKLCGGCIHTGNGSLGVASFDRAEERKVELLKAAGFTALRCAHNPPSPAFLDVCDRLGMLVLDESFDCWEKGKNKFDYSVVFKDWWQRDLQSMILRDRNHPSVVLWSIGNEIPEQFQDSGAELARQLADYVRALDTTRPITQAVCNYPKADQQAAADSARAALDIVGYNYNLKTHAKDHSKFPNRVMVATESFPKETFVYWDLVNRNPYIVGDFVWTAQDYFGESGIGRWCLEGESPKGHGKDDLYPWHGAICGDLDLSGERRPISHYRNILWGRGEKLHMAVREPETRGKLTVTPWGMYPSWESWTWPGQEGKELDVEISSSCDKIQLYLNDNLIGEFSTTRKDQFRANCKVAYQPGSLRAVGLVGGKKAAECHLKTAGPSNAIRMTADRKELSADGQDLSFVSVSVVDAEGQLQPNSDAVVHFTISGPGIIAGVENADLKRPEALYQGSEVPVFHGRALVVVRTLRNQAGTISLSANASGLTQSQVILTTKPAGSEP